MGDDERWGVAFLAFVVTVATCALVVIGVSR